MPANSSWWGFHCLARETGKLGHLYSPGDQRGPWPWFPYALDNGNFKLADLAGRKFDYSTWTSHARDKWQRLLFWAQVNRQKPLWGVVPDVPGFSEETFRFWEKYAPRQATTGVPLALAVQDGMTTAEVRKLAPAPVVICVGGTTEWKWKTAEMWCSADHPRSCPAL